MRYSVTKDFRLIADFYTTDEAVEYAKTRGANVKVRERTTGVTLYDSEKDDK